MIGELLLNLMFNVSGEFFTLLPDVEWSIDSSAFTAFFDVLHMAGYLLPMKTVLSIFSVILSLNIFKIVISFIRTIWDLLPFT